MLILRSADNHEIPLNQAVLERALNHPERWLVTPAEGVATVAERLYQGHKGDCGPSASEGGTAA